jgi:hypothetical protein
MARRAVGLQILFRLRSAMVPVGAAIHLAAIMLWLG